MYKCILCDKSIKGYDRFRLNNRRGMCFSCFQREFPNKCPSCGGFGKVDSGEYDSNGKPKMIHCNYCNGTGRPS